MQGCCLPSTGICCQSSPYRYLPQYGQCVTCHLTALTRCVHTDTDCQRPLCAAYVPHQRRAWPAGVWSGQAVRMFHDCGVNGKDFDQQVLFAGDLLALEFQNLCFFLEIKKLEKVIRRQILRQHGSRGNTVTSDVKHWQSRREERRRKSDCVSVFTGGSGPAGGWWREGVDGVL